MTKNLGQYPAINEIGRARQAKSFEARRQIIGDEMMIQNATSAWRVSVSHPYIADDDLKHLFKHSFSTIKLPEIN